ncbi:MAG: group II intron reverse transcriptase/maturase [Candidatus Thiodiazotropha sp. (ex Lucinoma annulata)]|nr:group II intron reverse transcriptase/maturase [Candidatus Thiodiazotropha sp. (ex Lucinoma annulata)]
MASVKQLSLSLTQSEDESEMGDLAESKSTFCSSLIDRVLERNNLVRALKQVLRNKGAPGIDGMTVDALPDYLKEYWPRVRRQLIDGCYKPKPVRRVEIPKPDGRMRKLGIPTVLDRLIQQAIAQVLQEDWDGDFHDNSYGFRPNRSAHQAMHYAQSTLRQDYRWVVDCDLEAFFDGVNHDLLMEQLKARHQDPHFLRLINRYLKAGVQLDGTTQVSIEGVPQGGPLSPVLSNIVLNQLDWELERRGHRFVRYADDFVVFVKSQAAGERVMKSLQRYIGDSLRLKVNTQKSAVDRPWKRTFLGFTFSRRDRRIKVSNKALMKLKSTIKLLSRRTRGHSLKQVIADLRKSLLGWKAYFDISEVLSPLRDLDKWIRRRLRSYVWKQWGRKGYRMLRRLGVDRRLAWNTAKSAHGPWRLSASPALYRALPNSYFRNLGLPELAAR